ncbi:hypothetical protein LCGC14_0536140 [marine sediment metagenome]|uniref:Uncharacterized protein n=1 Tax=marine sediment metagenome TaxID=412755 RepID=A0A0F9SCL2_9ZZZZ
MASNISEWLSTMYQDYTAGRAQKETAFQTGVGSLQSYADIFKPGGEYGKSVEAMIGRGEKRAVASGMQNIVSAGLAGTTMPMHLQQTYEEEIGMPARLRGEDVRMERLGGALGSLGQMYASYDPGTASMGDIGQMVTSQANIEAQRYAANLQASTAQSALRAAERTASAARWAKMTTPSWQTQAPSAPSTSQPSFYNPYQY